MSYFYKDNNYDGPKIANIALVFGGILISATVLWLWVGPTYRVWSQGLKGRAELARAEQNRQISIKEAEAKKDSAAMLAEAEVLRAEGVAQANKIIADGLGGPEGYLRYLYIDMLQNKEGQVIYIPTEAGLPILEAGKR